MKTMGRGGNNIRQRSVCGTEQKQRYGGGGIMATVRHRVTAGYHSCTGPEQCLAGGLVGLHCALGEIQDKGKHQERTMILAFFTKVVFPVAAGEDAQRIQHSGGTDIMPRVLNALLAAQHLTPLRYTGGRLCFWPSTSCLLNFSKHL